MKKLVLGIFFAITQTACYGQTLTEYCLNGYTKDEAKQMVKNFAQGGLLGSQPTHIWFSSDMVIKMLAMLTKDQVNNSSRIIDGIRIYYGRAGNENTVILVPTYDTIINGKNAHQDYFEPSNSDVLYSVANVKGQILHTTSNGAQLYSTCGNPCPDDVRCPLPPKAVNYITRKHGEDLVQNLGKATMQTKCVWFPLCLFTRINMGNYDGTRIYFATHLLGDASPYQGRDTFIIENTLKGADINTHVDAFDCVYVPSCGLNLDNLVNTLVPMKKKLNNKLLSKSAIKKMRIDIRKLLMNDGFDNGEQCLYNCDGVSL